VSADPNQIAILLDPTGAETREAHAHGAVGEAVRGFFVKRWRSTGYRFHAERLLFRSSDILRYVVAHEPVADGTTTRVMRLMREDDQLDYEVPNRGASQYRIRGVRLPDGTVLGEIRE